MSIIIIIILFKGLFVISGVKTCGNTLGYCLLGSDCTIDDDFLPDPTGNCDGLKRAFTPSAPFACCKFNQRSKQSGTPIVETNTKKTTNTVTKNKFGRNTRENIDSSLMNSDQLAKLNEIELVVKKIVEQLINETANNIKTEEPILNNETKMEENTIRNSINDEKPTMNDIIEIKDDTTMDPSISPEKTLEEEYLKKDIPLEIKNDNETNTLDTTELETEESTIDDEFKAEKRICQKSCKSEVTFLVDKKTMCYGTFLDDIWILTSATCASR